MGEESKEEILELIIPFLTERLGKNYIKDEEYKKVSKSADLLFKELNNSLNHDQSRLLEQFFNANNATIAVMERLIYQQGMRDLLNLFISLLKD